MAKESNLSKQRQEKKQIEDIAPTILDTAKALVYGMKNADYGHPSNNFQNIADLWNAYLNICQRERDNSEDTITVIDVAIFNVLQKIARLATNPTHRDTIIDIAGYAGTIERIVDEK